MGQYRSTHTGPQIDAGVDAALNPDTVVTEDSDALVTSGAVADALANVDPTITTDTDTTITGLLKGNGTAVSAATAGNDYVAPSDLTDIRATGSTNGTGATISAGRFFYLNNVLVQAKTDIANGATFTNGTNYEHPTAGALNALKSALETPPGGYATMALLMQNSVGAAFAYVFHGVPKVCTIDSIFGAGGVDVKSNFNITSLVGFFQIYTWDTSYYNKVVQIGFTVPA